MPSEVWNYAVAVVSTWEAIALGAGALFITLLVHKVTGKDIPNSVLWYGGIAMFFIASFSAWRQEHHQVQALEERFNPTLSLDIYEFGIVELVSNRTVIGLLASVANSGAAPSVCDQYLLSVCTPDGECHNRKSLWVPNGVAYKEPRIIDVPQNELSQKTSGEPVEPGARVHGYLLFEIDAAERAKFSDDRTQVTLSCRDIHGNRVFYRDSMKTLKTYTRFPAM